MKNPFSGTRYANVAATLALVVALGGTGYAAATIGTADIKNNAVTSAKIKDKNVKTADLKGSAVNSAKIKDNGVRLPDVADIQMFDLTLLNGWTPWVANRGAKYGMTPDGRVVLSGGVKQAGAFNGVIAVLPPGFRPIADSAWLTTNTFAASGPARINVDTDGTVTVQPGAGNSNANAQGFTSLDGLSFVR